MHRKRDRALDRGEIDVDAAVIVGDIRRIHLLIGFRTAVNCEILFRLLIGDPDGGPAGGLGRHDVDAVSVLDRQACDARADEFHDFILDIAVRIDRADDGERDVLRADTRLRSAGEVDRDNARAGNVVGASDQLLGELAAAFADRQRAESAVAGVAVGTQDHAAAAAHKFTVDAVDDSHVGRHIDAAVFMRRGEREHVVILVDRSADCAERVVAVGQDVRHRELLHTGSSRCLDDADIGDIVAGHGIEFHFQMLHIAGAVVGCQDSVCHRALQRFLGTDVFAGLSRDFRRIGHDLGAVYEIDTAVVEFNHE